MSHQKGRPPQVKEGQAALRRYRKSRAESLRGCRCSRPVRARRYLGEWACRKCGELIGKEGEDG